MKNILKKLLAIQCELKCKKDKQASSYKYRSAEDILENLKPILEQTETTLIMKDEVVEINGSSYFKTTVTLYDLTSEESIENYSYTREGSNIGTRKDGTVYEKMSEGQLSGATISYCRKYALCGMFAIDDGEDLDSQDKKEEKPESSTMKNLIEARDRSIEMLYNGFKASVENIDLNNEVLVERILQQGRGLVKYGNEEIKAEVTKICLGIKNALDSKNKMGINEMLEKYEAFRNKGLPLNEQDILDWLHLQDEMEDKIIELKSKYLEEKIIFDRDTELKLIEFKELKGEDGKKIYTEATAKAKIDDEFMEKEIELISIKATYENLMNKVSKIIEYVNIVKLALKKDFNESKGINIV